MNFKNINPPKIKETLSIGLVLVTLTTPVLAKEYKIQKGDTLSKISLNEYGKTHYYDELAYYNYIDNPDIIKVGQVIELPPLQSLLNYTYDEIYTVKKGDTLGRLCKEKYGSTRFTKALALYNDIKNINLIKVGQIIRFPNINKICNLHYRYPTGIYHTVKKGETLEFISKMYYKTKRFKNILGEYNCLDNNNLRPGQIIFIPSYETLEEMLNACKELKYVK